MDKRAGPVKRLQGIAHAMPNKNEEKAKRLAAALRENLRKRKMQQDGRDAPASPDVGRAQLPPTE